MRITFVLLLSILGLLLSAASENAMAQESKFGAGAQLLNPTGLTAKYNINEYISVTALTSFRISEFNNSLIMQANLLFKERELTRNVESGDLYPYYGGGIQFAFNEVGSDPVSIRVPVGIEYILEENPIGFYMDIAPTIDLSPGIAIYLGSSLGARFYFN